MRIGHYHIVAIIALLLGLILSAIGISRCNPERQQVIDIEELQEKIEFLVDNDVIHSETDSALLIEVKRLDTVDVKTLQRLNILTFDINRAVAYLAEKNDIPVDSIWAYVESQRAAKIKAQSEK